jgi:hypothetical protein
MAFWNDPTNLIPKQKHRWVISFGDREKNASFTGKAESLDDNTMHFFLAKSVDRPNYSIKTVSAKYLYSHTFKFPTRPVWNPITITFYDAQVADDVRTYLNNPKINGAGTDIENVNQNIFDTSKALFKQSTQFFFYDFLRKSGYYDPEEYERDDQLLRFRSYNFKRNMIESLVGSNGSNLDFTNGTENNTLNYKTLNITEYAPDGTPQEMWRIANPLITDVKFDKLDYSADDIPLITVTVEYDWASLEPQTKTVENVDTYIADQAKKRQQLYKDATKQIDLLLEEKLGEGFTKQQAEQARALIEEELQQKLAFLDKKSITELQSAVSDSIKKSPDIKNTIGDYQQASKSSVGTLEERALSTLEKQATTYSTKIGNAQKLLNDYNTSLSKLSDKALADYSVKTGISVEVLKARTSDERTELESLKARAESSVRYDTLTDGFKNVALNATTKASAGKTTAYDIAIGYREASKEISATLADPSYNLSNQDREILKAEALRYDKLAGDTVDKALKDEEEKALFSRGSLFVTDESTPSSKRTVATSRPIPEAPPAPESIRYVPGSATENIERNLDQILGRSPQLTPSFIIPDFTLQELTNPYNYSGPDLVDFSLESSVDMQEILSHLK